MLERQPPGGISLQELYAPRKGVLPSHRIRESELDARVRQYAEELRCQWTAEQADLRRLHRLWEMKRPAINDHIAELYAEIQRLEQEIDDLLLEKIQSTNSRL